ncbi:MAG: tetratricopeptide repeat protein [Planctomycetes bacterium]|nr:tetratricopeptide repeat protein [Planctomycetota bacterium]
MSTATPFDSAATGAATARGPLCVLLCTLLALLAWLPASRLDGWAYDDREVLEHNGVVQGTLSAAQAFRQDYWSHLGAAGHYRPLATLSLRLDLALHGESPAGFHRTNALLHAAVVMLAGLALVLLGVYAPARPFPWIGLALFATHPSLADSVAWISGRTSSLSACGGLVGVVLLAHFTVPWRDESAGRLSKVGAAAGLGTLLALLAKEDGLIFAPLLVLLGLAHSRRAAVAAALGAAAALALYTSLRACVYGSPWPSAPHAPLAAADFSERWLVGGRALLEAVRVTALPFGHPLVYERSAVFEDVQPWLGALGWCAWLAALVWGWRRMQVTASRGAGLAAWLACAAFLPLVQLVPAGVLFAPRFLYVPMLLGVLALDEVFRSLAGRFAPWAAALLLAGAIPTAWWRSSVYESKATFYAEQLRHVPDDAPAHNELALALEGAGDVAGALRMWQRALELDPNYGRPWSNLGRLALAEGDLERAERCLRRAAELGRGNALAHANLGALLLRREKFAEAASSYEEATRRAPGMAHAWRGLAKARLALADYHAAERAAWRAHELGLASDAEVASVLRECSPHTNISTP